MEKENKMQSSLSVAHHDYQKRLNAYAFFKVHDHDIGQDLVQETFMKTWRYLVNGGKIEMMRAFLYHVLNFLIIDEYRKRKNASLDDLVEKGFEQGNDDSEKQVNIIDGKGAIQMISRLPTKYQRVMKMRFKQLLSLKEISLLTGQSKNAVAVQIHRGLAKLRQLYNRP